MSPVLKRGTNTVGSDSIEVGRLWAAENFGVVPTELLRSRRSEAVRLW